MDVEEKIIALRGWDLVVSHKTYNKVASVIPSVGAAWHRTKVKSLKSDYNWCDISFVLFKHEFILHLYINGILADKIDDDSIKIINFKSPEFRILKLTKGYIFFTPLIQFDNTDKYWAIKIAIFKRCYKLKFKRIL